MQDSRGVGVHRRRGSPVPEEPLEDRL